MTKIRFLKHLIITSFLGFTIHNTQAQHCAFDGLHIIILKTNQKIKKTVKAFYLQEIENNKADSCIYASGLINKLFIPMDSIYSIDEWIKKYETKLGVTLSQSGNFFALLNISELNCMLKRGNDFELRERRFILTYNKNGIKKIIKIKSSSIYALCTSTNNWKNIPVISL